MEKHRNPVLIFLIFLLVYALGSFSKIPFGDCMALVLDTELGDFVKVATPTSHFLYTNAAVLIKKFTALDAIFVSRDIVILCGAFVVMMVYKTTRILTQKNWIPIVAAFVFGFSFTFWRNAEIIEVYTFSMVWVSLFVHYLTKVFWVEKNRETNMVLAAFFLSVSLWAHIQNIFFIPSLVLMLVYFKTFTRAIIVSLLLPVLSFALMIWLNFSQNLPVSSIFKSGESTWVADSFKKDAFTYAKDFIKAFGYLLYNFNVFTIAGIFGIVALYHKNRKLFYTVSVAGAFIFGFATFYAVSDNYVFFLPFNYIFALSIGLGLASWKNQKRIARLSPACLLIPLLYVSALGLSSRLSAAKTFDDAKAYKGGLRYYLVPWMTDNVGILEFTLENRPSPEPVYWMVSSARDYIGILRDKGFTTEQIKQR